MVIDGPGLDGLINMWRLWERTVLQRR